MSDTSRIIQKQAQREEGFTRPDEAIVERVARAMSNVWRSRPLTSAAGLWEDCARAAIVAHGAALAEAGYVIMPREVSWGAAERIAGELQGFDDDIPAAEIRRLWPLLVEAAADG